MSAPMAYAKLEQLFARLANIENALGILNWDMATTMPKGAAETRADQMATLKTLHHEMLTAPQVEDWLAAAGAESLSGWQSANLHEMRREWVHSAAVPGALVEALTKISSACEMTWRDARANADFKAVAPLLSQVLDLTRETAQVKSERLGCGLYDALLDQYEPGGKSEAIDAIFADLAAFLPGFLQQVLDYQGELPPAPPPPFAADKQKELGLRLMHTVGFDFDRGRLDISTHPFCGGAIDDVRITTRYDESDFSTSMMGVLHETGHALYELGLPKEWRNQPVGRARGMSVHESQSLLLEMQACRSREFLTFAAPLMRDAFGGSGPAWDIGSLHRHAIRVEPGFIRVDADEVTYPAHVILRYRLEKALIAGDLRVADIPGAWNDGMKGLLGIVPPDDRLGCLQDIHWYDGAFGYFPTYSLGAMTAAQLFDAAKRADPDILPAIARGDFAPLLAWLRANVHSHGSKLAVDELLTQATGKPLDAEIFKAHLRQRYLA